jgi:hypothetical protein
MAYDLVVSPGHMLCERWDDLDKMENRAIDGEIDPKASLALS